MLATAAIIALAVTAFFLYVGLMTARVSGFDPCPQRTSCVEDEVGDDGFPEIDWEHWQGVNKDVIGWITVPGTEIDCPVVQGSESDPTYYLRYDVYGDWNYHGAPYLSYKCAEGGLLNSGNALVFGHHLRDGTMFSELANFSKQGFAGEHSPILLQTPSSKARLNVLAVDVVDANRTRVRTDFAEGLDHALWLAELVSGSDLDMTPEGFDFGSVENVVTLCTCSYNYWGNERTLVICAVEEVTS